MGDPELERVLAQIEREGGDSRKRTRAIRLVTVGFLLGIAGFFAIVALFNRMEIKEKEDAFLPLLGVVLGLIFVTCFLFGLVVYLKRVLTKSP